MKVYVTKYALTEGIFLDDAEPGDFNPHYLFRPGKSWLDLGRDAFETREAAEEQARAMASKKIASLRKQIVQLEKLAQTPKWK